MQRFTLAILMLLCASALLAETPDTLSTSRRRTYRLQGIQVVAERETQALGTLEVKEFDPKTATADLNVAQSVADVNGIAIITGGKSGSTLSIRGFENDQIKFFLDGRPLGGGYFGNVDLNTLPVSEIKNIQILKGPVSALYGSDTMGGVVNIVTRSAVDQPLLKLGIQFRRNNTNKQYISLAKAFDLFDVSLYGSRYHTDGFVLSKDFVPTPFENGDIRNNAARHQYDIQTKLGATLWGMHPVQLQAGYTTMDTKEIPGNIYENELRKFIDWKRYQLSASGDFQLNDFLSSDLTVYYDAYDDTYAEYNTVTGEMYGTWPSYLESWKFGMRNNYTWQLSSNWETQFGLRWEKEAYNRKDNGSYLTWTSNNQEVINLFNQHEIGFGKFTVTAGLGGSMFKAKGGEEWQTNIEPSAALYYRYAPGGQVALSASRNTKYPVMHQLFSSSSGNPDLKPEQATKTELALTVPLRGQAVQGSVKQAVYYNWVKDLIEKDNTYTYVNYQNADTYGYECSVNLHFLWDHQWEYALVRYGKESDVEVQEFPRHAVKLKETVRMPWDVSLSYKAAWNDVRYFEDGSLHVTLAPYWVHSLYIDKALKNVTVKAGVENIFDTSFMEKYGHPGAGIDFVLNLEYRIH